MIDHLFRETFPPVWVKETEATRVVFPWTSGPIPADPKLLLVAEGAQALLTCEPTPGGSHVYPTAEGLIWDLSAEDAASLRDRTVLFGLWIDRPPMHGEPDQAGVLVVSDWAFALAEGTA